MPEKDFELLIEVSAEIKLAIERTAEARGMTISEFVKNALRKSLIDAGYIADGGPTEAAFGRVGVLADQIALQPAPFVCKSNGRLGDNVGGRTQRA